MTRTTRTIVHIVAHYPPSIGGMQKVAEGLANRQVESGLRVKVITSKIGQRPHYKDKYNIVKRLAAFEIAHTTIMPGLLFALWRTPNNAVFHVHVAQAGLPEIAILVALLRRIPVIMHIHSDVEASGKAGWLLPLYKKHFLRHALRKSDALIVPTEHYKQLISTKYNISPKLISVVPAGIDEMFFKHKKTTEPDSSAIRLLSVGRLITGKNVELIIKALDYIRTPAKLTIVGDGPLQKRMERIADQANKNGKDVELVGRKSTSELVSYFENADIYLLASDYESQSLTVIEAMASSTPVITTKIPAVHEVSGGATIEVEKNARAFADAINSLVKDKLLWDDASQRGIKRAQVFSWDSALSKLNEVYICLNH